MTTSPIALVTGASRGVGREICAQLKEQGCHVVLTARNEEAGAETARQLGAEFLRLDVLDTQEIESARAWIEKIHGRLDILVNNAGVLLDRNARLATMKMELLEQSLATNALAPIFLIRSFIPLLLRSNHPRIVNISSRLAQVGSLGPGTPAYRISKLALNAATAVLAAELADTPIKINGASPGWVRTHMGGDDAPNDPAEGAKIAVRLALIPDDGPTGKFFEGDQEIPW